MAGLIGTGQAYKDLARGSLQEVARTEQQRKITNDQLEAQQKQGMISNVASGAGLGFAVGGPAGAAIGAGIGLLGSIL
ncbi:MAG: hypothetical protein Q8L99_04585 [Polycyclovorans sp.]|nr:hypothetical protein [Polycyclovorans sp.]